LICVYASHFFAGRPGWFRTFIKRPIFYKATFIHSSIVAILELIRGTQCFIEVIRSSETSISIEIFSFLNF
jgi:hypothetical protein